jgi:4-hydroxybutyryl-CoA dehydratase/vinylacetyl-CoA-Delta-isomerase
MIRTVEQYLESLRDGRVLYNMGERVRDVTTHPVLRRTIQNGAIDWIAPNLPETRPLFVTKNEEGEEVHFLWTSPRTAEDLLRRREVYITGARFGGVSLHCMGVDGLAACRVLAGRVDQALGTHYTERVEAYRKYIQKTDIGLTTAQTDAKGDRSLHPSQQAQHKDFYVRVVDKKKDGIIVRGCKYHISSTPSANEAFVIPCRTHGEEDKDYAVAFATPLNAKGITLICADPEIRGPSTEETIWDAPVASRSGVGDSECMIVFDDVFVPWERVFLCGEWQFSRDIAYLFATFHRLFACCRMVPMLENLTGIATLMAEYNGLEKYSHIREKLSWMVQVTEAFKVITQAACMFPEKEKGMDLVNPNQLYINIAKFMYADNFHEMCKVAQDICGGIAADPLSYRDWMNPEERKYIDKYLAGKAGVPTEHRLKAIRFVHDITGGRHLTHQIHAEGSLAAQKMMFYANADFGMYKASAMRAANIPGWEKDATQAKLKDFRSLAATKMPPLDTKYKIMQK